MKRWGILPEEFQKVDTNKFENSSKEEDDYSDDVLNTIRRIEAQEKKEKEEEERAKDPLGRSKDKKGGNRRIPRCIQICPRQRGQTKMQTCQIREKNKSRAKEEEKNSNLFPYPNKPEKNSE